MSEAPFTGKVEPVAGELAGDRAEQVVGFLADHAGLDAAEARRELAGVACLALDSGGALAGVSTVAEATVPMIGGVRLWVHRCLLRPEAAAAEDAMLTDAFDALDATYEPDGGGPIGLCQVIRAPGEMRRTPEAVSPRSGLVHAGFLEDGSQVRIRYFGLASIGPRATPLVPVAQRTQPPELEERYRIEPLTGSAATPDDVLALWAREGAVPAAEAERRVHEVDLVAIDEDDGLVGIASSYLQRNNQLGMDLRYFRAFVAQAHRRSSLAFLLALRGRDHLEGLHASGADTRAAGIIYEVENELLKRYRNEAHWVATDFTYIGETPHRSHVRVHYFPGARVPIPS